MMKEGKTIRTLLVSGGIGSGKSFVIDIFNALGVPSYDADSRAKGLYDTDAQLLAEVVEAAGEDVLREGRLDRRALAARIFASDILRARIEDLVHPAVMRDFAQWRGGLNAPLVIMESAILMEHPALMAQMDAALSVVAPMETRISRVVERDRCTREQAMARISCQWDDSKRMEHSDFVIINDGEQALLPQIVNILKTINDRNNGKD